MIDKLSDQSPIYWTSIISDVNLFLPVARAEDHQDLPRPEVFPERKKDWFR